MAEQVEQLRQQIETTRAHLGEHLDQLATKAEQAVDVRRHIEGHPWATVAAALAAGFLLGRARNHVRRNGHVRTDGALAMGTMPSEASRPRGWLADELDLLMLAAGKTVFGLLRNAVRREEQPLRTR